MLADGNTLTAASTRIRRVRAAGRHVAGSATLAITAGRATLLVAFATLAASTALLLLLLAVMVLRLVASVAMIAIRFTTRRRPVAVASVASIPFAVAVIVLLLLLTISITLSATATTTTAAAATAPVRSATTQSGRNAGSTTPIGNGLVVFVARRRCLEAYARIRIGAVRIGNHRCSCSGGHWISTTEQN